MSKIKSTLDPNFHSLKIYLEYQRKCIKSYEIWVISLINQWFYCLGHQIKNPLNFKMRMSKISTSLIQIEAIRCTGDYLLHLTSKNRTETKKFIFRYFLFPNLEIISGKKKFWKHIGTTSSTTPTNLSTEIFSKQLISFKPSWSETYCIFSILFVLAIIS